MIEQAPKEEILNIIKEIEFNPKATQRTISGKLGISLGKTNYLLKELIKKGFIKVRNFSNNPGKLKKIRYSLTEDGIKERLGLTYHFLKRKEQEYSLMKNEWEHLTSNSDER
jgi:EPS-associated MarR family transcriptional regulator